MTPFWDFSIRQTRIAFWRTYGSDWQSLDWSSIQKRRAGSSSGGLPKRTGNEEQKTNPRRSISWALHISVQRTGSGDLPCDARRSASACGPSCDRSSRSSTRACTIPCLELANGSNRSCRVTSTTTQYQETSKASRRSGTARWALVADPSPLEPEASTLLDTHANAG